MISGPDLFMPFLQIFQASPPLGVILGFIFGFFGFA